MWNVNTEAEYERRRRKWPRKYRRELVAMHDNADTLLTTLNAGATPGQCGGLGFVHTNYPHGLLSIDQKGAGSGVAQSRLYVYPDADEEVLFLITMGDKGTQNADVKFATEWVVSHLESKASESDQDG